MLRIILCARQIEYKVIDRFFQANAGVFQDAQVYLYTDKIHFNTHNWHELVVPEPEGDGTPWSKTRSLNRVLRMAGEGATESDIIIQTDIDIRFTPDVIRFVEKTVKPAYGVACICANLSASMYNREVKLPWHIFRKRNFGYGACLAMTKFDWFRLHGFDERMEGHGLDDDEIFHRACCNLRMLKSDKYPLYHLFHQPREKVWPERATENKVFNESLDWRDENWGLIGV